MNCHKEPFEFVNLFITIFLIIQNFKFIYY